MSTTTFLLVGGTRDGTNIPAGFRHPTIKFSIDPKLPDRPLGPGGDCVEYEFQTETYSLRRWEEIKFYALTELSDQEALIKLISSYRPLPKTDTDWSGRFPVKILEAADSVCNWMAMQGIRYWQLGGICDRRFATEPRSEKKRG
tara:strand:+ start:604 stop:1035 length:432 start_codon:yes stop_codon:yes gene_type:complete